MTKADAAAEFERRVIPELEPEKSLYPNFAARREAWELFLGQLASQNQISQRQAESWTPPAFVRGPIRREPPERKRSPYVQPRLFQERNV